jgi:hypothetical protein
VIVLEPATRGAVNLVAVVAGGLAMNLIVPTLAITLFPTWMLLARINYVSVDLVPRS